MEASNAVEDDETRSSSSSGLTTDSEADIFLPEVPPYDENADCDANDGLSEAESFMTLTQEEQSAWEEMIRTLQSEVTKRGEVFSEWTDKITRRRMFAYSRMKHLDKFQVVRREFYGNIDGFIEKFHGDVLKRGAVILVEGGTDGVNSDAQTDGDHFRTDSQSPNIRVPMNSPEKHSAKDRHTPTITAEPAQVAPV